MSNIPPRRRSETKGTATMFDRIRDVLIAFASQQPRTVVESQALIPDERIQSVSQQALVMISDAVLETNSPGSTSWHAIEQLYLLARFRLPLISERDHVTESPQSYGVSSEKRMGIVVTGIAHCEKAMPHVFEALAPILKGHLEQALRTDPSLRAFLPKYSRTSDLDNDLVLLVVSDLLSQLGTFDPTVGTGSFGGYIRTIFDRRLIDRRRGGSRGSQEAAGKDIASMAAPTSQSRPDSSRGEEMTGPIERTIARFNDPSDRNFLVSYVRAAKIAVDAGKAKVNISELLRVFNSTHSNTSLSRPKADFLIDEFRRLLQWEL